MAPVLSAGYRVTSHLTAWLVWHSLRVSLLGDLPVPAPPHASREAA